MHPAADPRGLERAYASFFARTRLPALQKKGQSGIAPLTRNRSKLDQANAAFFLPKLGWLRYRNSRTVLGE